MPRPIDTNTNTALAQPIAYVAVMVSIALTSGSLVLAWSGMGDLTYGGQTYKGVGKLGKISAIEESNAVFASGVQITLKGVDATNLSEALQDITVGLAVTIYYAIVQNNVIVGTPVPIFAGNTDQVSISEGTETASITIDVESKLSQLQRNREYRYTDQMQRYLHPGDGAFKYVNMLTNYLGTWGFKNGNG